VVIASGADLRSQAGFPLCKSPASHGAFRTTRFPTQNARFKWAESGEDPHI
jgi:hypothetical protein